ncbi:hypothetical protein SY86_09795 [Erwinia tracheiphila]|uniref:Uncharacterized protein n=1 Tax=Erwinia tracheiphila TaxID=65700 RepID=A0A0M2KFC7_9GAMM|nr:hypothetical protein SY86_09795 [Erwinia tracheiphila]
MQPKNRLSGLASRISEKAHTTPDVVFLCVSTVTSQWWGVWGSRKARRVLFSRSCQPCTSRHQ